MHCHTAVLKAGNTPNRKGPLRKGGGGAGPPPTLPEASALSIFDDNLEGCSSFMVASSVFLRLIQSEVKLMEDVIPTPHHTHVLDSFIKQPMDFFMSRGEAIFQQARKNVTHHDYSVVLSCLRLLRHVKLLLPEYRIVLQASLILCVSLTSLCVCIYRVWSPNHMIDLFICYNSLIGWYV